MIFDLLIVDDEATTRKGLANYMNWSSIGCQVVGTASDGSEAIEFVKKTNVDIIITDVKMPDTDGLAVAKFIYESFPDIKVIILTGYAEFEYAKTAIKYNVSAFIVKPTNKKDLFEAVQDAQKQIITSKKQSSIAKEEYAFLKEQLLQEMTALPLNSTFEKRLNELGICLNSYYIVAFRLIPLDNDIAFLKKIIIDEKKNAYCYRYDRLIIAVYFLDEESNSVPNFIIENCLEISNIAYTLDSRKVSIGISRYHNMPLDFGTAVSEAIYALRSNFYSENSISLFSQLSSSYSCDLNIEYSLELFQFENLLYNWDFEGAESILNKIFAKFKNSFANSWNVKNVCSQIYYISSRLLIKRNCVAPTSSYISDITDATDIFGLRHVMDNLMLYMKEKLFYTSGAQNSFIDNTIQYIHNHLSETLSLDIIADNLHISQSHLSRTFKKICNESLTEYINKARIQKAKEYLVSSDILTYEVADKVGYNDATYFSSIFKKYEGCSPSKYRTMQRNNKSGKIKPADLDK